MSQKAAKSTYQFPILGVEEMVEKAGIFFPEMHLSAADLKDKQLNSDRVQKIYLIFMHFLTGMTKEGLMQPTIDADFVQEFPGIHEEANYKLKFSMFMNRILVACSYEDFSLQDIITPERRNTLKVLSALFNFCAHYEGRSVKFGSIKDRQKAKAEQMQTMLTENDALRRKINDLKAEQVMQEEEEHQLKTNNEKLTEEWTGWEREAEGMKQEINRLKESMSEAKARKANTDHTLAALKERSAVLSSQIVQSPDRMKKEDARLLQTIERQRASVVERKNRLAAMTQQAQAAAELLSEMERPYKQLKAVTETVDTHKLEQEELRRLKEQSVDFQERMDALKQSEELVRRKLNARRERGHKQRLQDRNALDSLRHEKQGLDRKLGEQENADCAVQAEVMTLSQEVAALDKQLQQKVQNHAATMDLLKAKYLELKQALDVYHQHWANAYERSKETSSTRTS